MRPHMRAPNMLPGKAIRLPSPSRFLMRDAAKATPRPYHGPRSTAQRMFTICCIGAHLLPNTGKENKTADNGYRTKHTCKGKYFLT